MSVKFVSLCAGSSERFDSNSKHMLEVEGETLRARQSRQFGDVQFIDRARVGETRCTCETLMLGSVCWDANRINVLLGDVYYTDAAANRIKSSTRDLVFWSDEQDIFALSFDISRGLDIIRNCAQVVIGPIHNNGRLWELYRSLLRLPNCAPLPDDERMLIELVDDRTQDFDTTEEYEDFLKGISKNRHQK